METNGQEGRDIGGTVGGSDWSVGLGGVPPKDGSFLVPSNKRWGSPPPTTIVVCGAAVDVGDTIKYLGLTLDDRRGCKAHFSGLVPRVEGAAANLCQLRPNLGGHGDDPRRLYVGVMLSIAMYEAPI